MSNRLAFTAAALSALALAAPASATILTFDSDLTNPNVIVLDQTYGDNVTAAVMGNMGYGVGAEGYTPDVTVSYAAIVRDTGVALDPSNLVRWTTDYGDLVNVLENDYDGNSLTFINFAAAAGYSVDLYGFDLAGWPNSDYTIANISVFDGTTLLFSQDDVLVEGDATGLRHTSFDFSTPFSGANLSIRIDAGLGGASDNIGIDNVRFGQAAAVPVVPEPASWALMILGVGAIGGVLRRARAADRHSALRLA